MAKHPVWRGYDPTADKALARVYRQAERKRRLEFLQELETKGSRRGGKANARLDQEGRG